MERALISGSEVPGSNPDPATLSLLWHRAGELGLWVCMRAIPPGEQRREAELSML